MLQHQSVTSGLHCQYHLANIFFTHLQLMVSEVLKLLKKQISNQIIGTDISMKK